MIARIVDNNNILLDNMTVPEEDAVMERFTVTVDSRYANPDSGGFNGVYRRYDKARRRLARPFLGELRALCLKLGLPLVVQDEREPWNYQITPQEEINADFLPGITLEQYQIDAIRLGCRVECCIFDVPTGGGKTEIAAGLCKAMPCPTVILADQRIVIDQLKQRLELRDVVDEVGLFYAGKTPSGQLVVAGSVQSLQAPSRMPPEPQYSDAFQVACERVKKTPELYGLSDNSSEQDALDIINDLVDKILGKMVAKHESMLKGFKKRKQRAKKFQEIVKNAEMIIVDECVHEDSFITTDHGLITAGKLHEFVQSGCDIMMSVNGKNYRILGSAHKRDAAVKVVTSTNRQLVTSRNHPFAVLTMHGIVFKHASSLVVGDKLLVQRTIRDIDVIDNIDNIWYHLGLFIGDGHFLNNVQVKFGVRKDIDDWSAVTKAIAKRWNGLVKHCINNRGDSVFRIKSVEFTAWLKSLGFEPGCKMGSINPKFVVPHPLAAVGILRGLFDAEGSSGYTSVKFDTVDRDLMLFAQQLLSYLGIGSTVMVGDKRTSRMHENKNHRVLWRIIINGDNLSKFYKIVGFGFKRKAAVNKYTASIGSDKRIDRSEFIGILKSVGIGCACLARIFGVSTGDVTLTAKYCISYDTLIEWISKLRSVATTDIADYSTARKLLGISDAQAAKYVGVSTQTAWNMRRRGDNSAWRSLVARMQNDLLSVLPDLPTNYAVELVRNVSDTGDVVNLIDFSVDDIKMYEANGLLVHNCDLASSSAYKMVFRNLFKGRRRYGFSGTPIDPAKPVEALFVQEHLGSIAVKVERRELERLGRIVPIKYLMFAIGDTPNEASTYDIAVKEKLVENEHFHDLIMAICQRYNDEKTLILVDRDGLGNAFAAKIPGAVFIHGKTTKRHRDRVLRDFENGTLKVVIGGKIIKRGLDLKGGCDNLIIATGGKLWSTFNQQIGRAVRVNQRGFGRVIDFLFLSNKHLYSHSRGRLRTVVDMGYSTKVVFADGQYVSGDDFIASRWRRPRPRTQIGRPVGRPNERPSRWPGSVGPDDAK